jgi:hypothetical protein
VAAEALIAQGAPAETIEKLAHLVNPPSCELCTYHVTASGNHICGWKACWQRKLQAWVQVEAEKLSKKLGIPVYEEKQDGECIKLDSSWREDQKQTFEQRIPGLRLMLADRSYGGYAFTGSNWIVLVDVTPEHVQAAKDEDAKRQAARLNDEAQQEEHRRLREQHARNDEAQQEEHRRLREQHARNDEQTDQFLRKLAIPVFATIWDPIKNGKVFEAMGRGFCEYFVEDENGEYFVLDNFKVFDENTKNLMRRGLTDHLLWEEVYELRQNGPVGVAEHLQGVAKDWDVKLPADWLEKAKAFAEMPPEPDPEDTEEEIDDEAEDNDD